MLNVFLVEVGVSRVRVLNFRIREIFQVEVWVIYLLGNLTLLVKQGKP